jgi:phage terminase Nu1 subunit (DNA packaging protein)
MAPTEAKKFVSLSAYAKRRGVSPNAVTKAIQSGRLRESVAMKGARQVIVDVELADREWAANTQSSVRTLRAIAGMSDIGVSRARFEAARAELAELDLAERKGELVKASDVADKFIEVVGSAKTKLLGLAVRVKQRLPHIAAEDVQVIDDLVREALEGLADGT